FHFHLGASPWRLISACIEGSHGRSSHRSIREPHDLWAIVIYVPRWRLAVVLSLSRHSGQTAGPGRAMVFNGRGWSRSSYTCHSACEILTAGAAGTYGQAFTGGRSHQPGSHACAFRRSSHQE